MVLTGTDLAFTTEVTFGTTPAPFTGLSDTQTLTISPAGTGTVLVTITTPAEPATASPTPMFRLGEPDK